MRDYRRLDAFLDRLEQDIYPEPRSDLHDGIVNRIMDELVANGFLASDMTVLDIGCGQGPALDRFQKMGCKVIGVTMGDDDIKAMDGKFEVVRADMSFLNGVKPVDFVWARQCLDHSPFPYFTLSGFYESVKPGGHCYFEVSAPNTACQHETNQNHYSIMGKNMWASLAFKCGFSVLNIYDMNFTVQAGPDTYWGFLCRRELAAIGKAGRMAEEIHDRHGDQDHKQSTDHRAASLGVGAAVNPPHGASSEPEHGNVDPHGTE